MAALAGKLVKRRDPPNHDQPRDVNRQAEGKRMDCAQTASARKQDLANNTISSSDVSEGKEDKPEANTAVEAAADSDSATAAAEGPAAAAADAEAAACAAAPAADGLAMVGAGVSELREEVSTRMSGVGFLAGGCVSGGGKKVIAQGSVINSGNVLDGGVKKCQS